MFNPLSTFIYTKNICCFQKKNVILHQKKNIFNQNKTNGKRNI